MKAGDVILKTRGRKPILVTGVDNQRWSGVYLGSGKGSFATGPIGSGTKIDPNVLTRAELAEVIAWKGK